MTSQPAKTLGLTNRGILQVGKKADILIFDPKKVEAKASYVNPHQLAEGFDVVIINGNVVRHNGVMQARLHGEVLKPE